MGEHPRATVVRELDEELGVRANHDIGAPLMLTCTTTVGLTAGHTDVSLWYVVQVSSAQVIRFDQAEFNSVRWFHLSEIPFERSDPHLRRFVRKLTGSAGAHTTRA
jgi:8-oxo-dGTP pyrophosphatase MutT (NUDIX family)